MSEQPAEDVNLSGYQKLIALGVVCLLMIILGWAYVAIFGKPSEQEVIDRAIQSCGNSRFSYEVDCPEPGDDYDPSKDISTPGY